MSKPKTRSGSPWTWRYLPSVSILLLLVGAGCSSGNDEAIPKVSTIFRSLPRDTVPVDYSLMPFALVKSRLPSCSQQDMISDLLVVPTPAEAEEAGYGRVDAILDEGDRMLRGQDVSSGQMCTPEEEEVVSAYSQALQDYLKSKVASSVYERWAKCMDRAGFDELADPRDRSVWLDQQLFSEDGVEPLDVANARVARLRPQEIELAVADVGCQASEIAPRANELADAQRSSLDAAPDKVRRLLGL